MSSSPALALCECCFLGLPYRLPISFFVDTLLANDGLCRRIVDGPRVWGLRGYESRHHAIWCRSLKIPTCGKCLDPPISRLGSINLRIRPSLDALSLMSEAELARVDNLAIGHYSYGKITWPGAYSPNRAFAVFSHC